MSEVKQKRAALISRGIVLLAVAWFSIAFGVFAERATAEKDDSEIHELLRPLMEKLASNPKLVQALRASSVANDPCAVERAAATAAAATLEAAQEAYDDAEAELLLCESMNP